VPTQGNNVLEGASRRPLQTVTCSRLQVHGTLVLVVVLAVQYARAAEPLPGDLEQLATEKSCYLCHRARPDTKTAGSVLPYAPSWVEIAAKYRGQKGAEERLTAIVVQGSDLKSRHWQGKVSDVGMLPNAPEVDETQARQLVRWILSFRSASPRS